MNPNNYITVTEAAALLGVSRQRILALIDKEKLRAQKIGVYYAVKRSDVEKRLASRLKGKNQ